MPKDQHDDTTPQAAYSRLCQSVGDKRARELLKLGEGIERVVQRNRKRSAEERRKEYRDSDFVDL